jgi:glycine/D-amino acid oxidase-like deaminating enzyme/nitrite reductase/ring-hydroxylating ferredoxin subunit
MMGSVWLETAPEAPAFARLDGDVSADVCVIGGGIVGITTALLLHEAGARVILIEANRVGHGVTGHTTAKVSSQHGLIYAGLRDGHGASAARTYAQANEAALAWIAARVQRDGIECDFRRRSAYTYVRAADKRADVEREVAAALEAGLPATLAETTPLPYPVAAAVRFADQAEFHAHKYLLALAAQLPADRVFERTHAIQVDSSGPPVVHTPGGRVTAEHVIVATHYPFPDRSLAFARVHPQRSYALACRIAGTPPDGMHISADAPTRSVRAIPVAGEELLLVGGDGHRPGTGGDTEAHYRALETFAREHWDVRSIEYRWSAQDNTSVDGLPLVGPMTPFESRVLMATGFAKWGMTNGTAAALILSDLVLGRENPWAALLDPRRLNLRAAAARLISENVPVGWHMVADRISKPGRRPIEDLAPGEGDIVRHRGEKVAGYRDEDGELTAVSSTCTHLGCQVAFNRAERSWDCPCHGSRFATDGGVLQGPAVHRLERKPI